MFTAERTMRLSTIKVGVEELARFRYHASPVTVYITVDLPGLDRSRKSVCTGAWKVLNACFLSTKAVILGAE